MSATTSETYAFGSHISVLLEFRCDHMLLDWCRCKGEELFTRVRVYLIFAVLLVY
jgi:hypothetical protein